jgi:hypothetical protein
MALFPHQFRGEANGKDVMPAPLPADPDIEALRRNAKRLRDHVRSGVDGAIALVRADHPRLTGLEPGSAEAAAFTLTDAQLTVVSTFRCAIALRQQRDRAPEREGE